MSALPRILVVPDAPGAAVGTVALGAHRWRCALGRSGVRAAKREGDGATPSGWFPLRRLWWRADRLPRPDTALPLRAIVESDGWCDDPASPDYNRPVALPSRWRHERMWRDDGLYDLVLELGVNDDPVIPGAGSAIFLHVARDGYAPTEGCVALALPDALALLKLATPDTPIEIRLS